LIRAQPQSGGVGTPIMATSPLELYEEAYRLHYERQDVAAARRLYETIISEFPESRESGYAAIQLQAIDARHAEARPDAPAHGALLPLIIALGITVLSAAAAGALLAMYLHERQARAHQAALTARVCAFVNAGRTGAAQDLLDSLARSLGATVSPSAARAAEPAAAAPEPTTAEPAPETVSTPPARKSREKPVSQQKIEKALLKPGKRGSKGGEEHLIVPRDSVLFF